MDSSTKRKHELRKVRDKEARVAGSAKMDIVFLMDASYGTGYFYWKKLKSLVVSIAEKFNIENSTRVGFIPYSNYIFVPEPLENYEDRHDLTDTVKDLHYHRRFQSYTALALNTARRMLKRRREKYRKQFVFVMTSGRRGHFRSEYGYEMIRRVSFKLRNDGVHIISIAVGNRAKMSPVMTMSSYPKEENTIKLERRDTVDDVTNKSLSIIEKVFSKTCFKSSLDVGIIEEPIDRDLRNNATSFIQHLITEIYYRVTNKTRVGLLAFNRRPRSIIFKDYGSSQHIDLSNDIRSYLRRRSRHFDIHHAVEQAFNERFLEKFGSIGKTKILILMTEEKIVDPHELFYFHKTYPEDKIKVFNVYFTQGHEKGLSKEIESHAHLSYIPSNDREKLVKEVETLLDKPLCIY